MGGIQPEERDLLAEYVQRHRVERREYGTIIPEAQRGNLPAVSGFVTRSMLPFLEMQGIQLRNARLLEDLPLAAKQKLAATIPSILQMGMEFDYRGLAEQAQGRREQLTPEAYEALMVTATMGMALQNHRSGQPSSVFQGLPYTTDVARDIESTRTIGQEALHQLTFGLVPAPPEARLGGPTRNVLDRVMGDLLGLGFAGMGAVKAIGFVTKAPKLSALWAQIPARYQAITTGVLAGSAIEAARPDGLPEEPASFDIPARIGEPIAEMLGGGEAAERIGLGIGGGVTGYAIGEILGGLVRGVRAGRRQLAAILEPDDERAVRTALHELGVEIAPGAQKKEVMDHLFANLSRIPLSERLAETVGERLVREQYVMNQLLERIGEPIYRPDEGLVASAIRLDDGRTFWGRAHFNAVEYAQSKGVTSEELSRAVDGFMTRDHKFVPRNVVSSAHGIEDVHSYDIDAIPDANYNKNIPTSVDAGEVVPTAVVRQSLDENISYLSAVFRANPGGMSIVRGLTTNVSAGRAVAQELGYNVITVQRGDAAIIARPRIVFPEVAINSRTSAKVNRFREAVERANEGRTTTAFSVLPDGRIVRGEVDIAKMVDDLGFTVINVGGRPDPARSLREGLKLITAQVEDDGGLVIDLASQISAKQVNQVLRLVGRNVPRITIRPAGAGQAPVTIMRPIQPQVEDALLKIVPGANEVGFTPQMLKRLKQFRDTGVFEGQAGILPDGYPVEVLRRVSLKGGEVKIHYRDPLTGARHAITEDNISLLPSSLEGELAPSTLFLSSLSEAEKTLFARLRFAVNEDMAKPIKTFAQLDAFASARGFRVSSGGKGTYAVWDANTGETIMAKNLRAAVRLVRQSAGPMPELTPPQVEELLGLGTGRINHGSVGGGSPTARFQERIPITEEEFDRVLNQKVWNKEVLDGWTGLTKPTQGLMAVMERKYNLPVQRLFMNYQTSAAHRQNFLVSWLDGGPDLPKGVIPLRRIIKMSGGTQANQRAITSYLEAGGDSAAAAAIARTMTKQELLAAQELRKWYDALFDGFGIERPYLRDYAPHVRTQMESGQRDIIEIWRRTQRDRPVPKWYEFFADNFRQGTLDAYEDRAFVAAMQYLNDGSHNRFMKLPLKEFDRLLKAIPDRAIRAPLENFFQAAKGFEFAGQKASMNAMFEGVMRSLGMNVPKGARLGERFVNTMLGLSYGSAMSFRPAFAARNLLQTLQTTWPMIGGMDDTVVEAFGAAMTRNGRDAAVRAGAVTLRQAAYEAATDVSFLPKWLTDLNEYGMTMYNNADQFNRAVAYHAGRIRAERAIGEFAARIRKGKDIVAAQRQLVIDSRAAHYDKPVVQEFIRRLADSPQKAAEFLGKHTSDLTQYLYGRGYQPAFQRSVPGRLFGQFGSWTFGYLDFVTRTTANLIRNGYHGEATKFIGRLAISNLAIYLTGREILNLDLRRWMGAHSLFWTGGPATEALGGIVDIMRGVPEYLSDPNSAFGQSRLTAGARTLQRVGRVFIPFNYAVRDLVRLSDAVEQKEPVEIVGSILGARPMREYTIQQQLEIFNNPGRFVGDLDRESRGDFSPSAVELLQFGMGIGRQDSGPQMLGGLRQPPKAPAPVPPQQPLGPSGTPSPGPSSGGSAPASPAPAVSPASPAPGNRPGLPPNLKVAESKPIQY